MECTSSKVAPVLDAVFTTTNLVSAAVAAGASDDGAETPGKPSPEASIALGVGFGVLFLGSAIYGFSTTARCDRIHHGSAPAPADVAPTGSAQPSSPAAPTSSEYD